MKKQKKRRPKTHGKAKQRQLPAAPGGKRRAPDSSTRAALANFFTEKVPETSAELIEMMSKMNAAQVEEFVRNLGKVSADDEPDDDLEPDEPNFGEFLDLCHWEEADARAEVEEFAPVVSLKLKLMKVEADFGNEGATRAVEAIGAALAEAIEDEAFPSSGLMTVAKVLADADWLVPEALKQAVVRSLQNGSETEADGELNVQRLVAATLRVSGPVGDDEFAFYEQVASAVEAFPAALAAQVVGFMVEAGSRLTDRAAVGFALHREPAIAAAAVDALAGITSRRFEGLVVERLARIRPLAPPDRHARIDAAIQAARSNSEPPVALEREPLLKVSASTCDTFGAQNLTASLREGSEFKTTSVLLYPKGILEMQTFVDATKAEWLDRLEALRNKTKIAETDVTGLTRLLSLGIADNLARGFPIKFRLVQFIEQLGVGHVTPRTATPEEMADEVLADLPSAATDADALARALGEIADVEWTSIWFEMGAEFDALLAAGAPGQSAAAIVADYIPKRKAFWSWVCARSALALRGPAGRPPDPLSIALAQIAKDLASDKSPEELPFLRKIAERSADLHEEFIRKPPAVPALTPR